MKKNFFKKLSFVMALAMIISVIAPAAGAFAATKSSLNATSKVLYLGTKTNKFDFNIKNHVKGSTYSWTIADKKVATVHSKYGMVTAVAPGSTKVTAKVTPKTGKAYTLSAKVIVRDNIKEVKITNVPEADLKVGQENDFNRTFKTVSGSTTRTLSVTRWLVDGEGATIDAKTGVFKATVPGEYKVKAVSFETDAQFDAWKADSEKNASKLLASDEVTVKVVPSIVETKQVDTNTFTVTFDSDMSKTDISKNTVNVYRIINGKPIASGTEKIDKFTLDATGKVATIDMFTDFSQKTEYNVVYDKLTGTFTSAEVSLAKIDSIDFADFNYDVESGTPESLVKHVTAKNADGVVIYSGTATDFAACLTFTYDGDVTKGYYDGTNKTIYLYSEGYQAPLTATFTYYSYNTETKTYDTIKATDSAVVTAVKADKNLNTSSIQYAVAKAKPAVDSKAWGSSASIAAGDTGFSIFARYKNNNSAATDAYVDAANRFEYVPSNDSKIIINGNFVYPIAAGTVTVLVKDTQNDHKVVGTFDITIMPARAFQNATLDSNFVTVNNNGTYGDKGDKTLATITVTDTMGDAALTAQVTPVLVTGPTTDPSKAPIVDVTTVLVPTASDFGKSYVKVNVARTGVVAGHYNYKLPLNVLGTAKDLYITVYVMDGQTDINPISWKLLLGENSFDLKNVKEAKSVSIEVAGYNKNGAQVAKLNDSTQYDVEITKDGARSIEGKYSDTSITVVSGSVSGSVLETLAQGTYVVTAKAIGAANPTNKVPGSVIGSLLFTVSDTTAKKYVVSNPVVAAGSALDVARSAFTLYLNDAEITDEAKIVGIKYFKNGVESKDGTDTVIAGQSIYIAELTYHVTNDNGTKTAYTFTVNQTIITK